MSRREQPSSGDSADRLRELNAACKKELAYLQRCVETVADGDAVSRMQDCFGKFSGALREKFDVEERASLFEDLAVKKPRLAARIEELHSGHKRLISELGDLEDRVRRLADAPAEAGRVRDGVLRFVKDLTAHEEREIEVIQAGFWREVGGSD